MTDIVAALSALAQQTRLEVIMRLSRGPASGQTSGDLATLTQTPASSMSTHLKILLRAVSSSLSAQVGRSSIASTPAGPTT